MNLESILHNILNFTGVFSPTLVIVLLIICSVGEFSLSIPYLLETIWLMSGYNLGTGALSPFHIILLWLTAQAGRQMGAMVLFSLSRLGSTPLLKLYERYFQASLTKRLAGNTAPMRFIRRIDYLSPFSIALGRLYWLRVPITLTLGVKRQPRVLSVGVVLSSLVWDGTYIILGLVGASATLKPLQMVMYSLAGLTILYAITFILRHIPRRGVRPEAGHNPDVTTLPK